LGKGRDKKEEDKVARREKRGEKGNKQGYEKVGGG